MTLSLAPFVLTVLCMLLRGFQLVFALVSLITGTMSFPTSTADGRDYRLGSTESTFALFVAYTIVEYSAAFLLLVELFPMVLRPRAAFTRTSDVFLATLALVSGITLASGDYTQHCSDYTGLVHCSNLKASSVFLLLSVVPLAGSLLLTFVKAEDLRLEAIECRDRAGSYRMVTTPMSSTPPIDNRDLVTATTTYGCSCAIPTEVEVRVARAAFAHAVVVFVVAPPIVLYAIIAFVGDVDDYKARDEGEADGGEEEAETAHRADTGVSRAFPSLLGAGDDRSCCENLG